MADEYITLKRPSGKPLHIPKKFFQIEDGSVRTRYIYGNAQTGIVDDDVFCNFSKPSEEEERSIQQKDKEKDGFGFITIYNNLQLNDKFKIIGNDFRYASTYFTEHYSGKEIVKIVAFSQFSFYYMLSSEPYTIYDKDNKVYLKFHKKATNQPTKETRPTPKSVKRIKPSRIDPDSDDLFKRLLGPTNQLVTKGQVQNKLSQLYEQLSDAARTKDQKQSEQIEARIWKLAENMGFNQNYGLDRQSVEKWINDFKKPATKRMKN